MDLSRLLAADPQVPTKGENGTGHTQVHQNRVHNDNTVGKSGSNRSTPPNNMAPKSVIFEYLLAENSAHHRARLPMRVNIYPHDGTDSIVTTVKNFYGLYDGNGVSFEDKDGNTLIARYENFADKMTVYVRVIEEAGSKTGTPSVSASPRRPRLQAPFDPQPVNAPNFGISRPSSRTAKKRSVSPPTLAGHRSNSVSTVKSRTKRSRVGSTQGDGEYDSDSDVGNASVTSSRRGKHDVLASAEISVDNIVEGGRRKRARFDSSELPLFVPSQVPGSISSISPQRRTGPPAAASPFQTNQHTFAYNLVPSPQSFSQTDSGYRTATFSASGSSYAAQRRSGHYSGRPSISGGTSGILPTPEPTVASVISDEDVALQLMRLGDASNYSAHGRTSTSTMDDGLSGKADASSGEDTDYGSGDDLPEGNEMVTDDSGEEYFDGKDGSFKGESDGILPEAFYRMPNKGHAKVKSSKSSKSKKHGTKVGPHPGHMMMPYGTPDMQQKMSASGLSFQHFQQPLGLDEEDLSSKPRCQRCRKSKKGCDRQRPCGRCRDAGIGIEGCVSEEENNGRKGRYGRHMGVSVKKEETAPLASIEGMHMMQPHPMMAPMSMAPPPLMGDKSKKRKR